MEKADGGIQEENVSLFAWTISLFFIIIFSFIFFTALFSFSLFFVVFFSTGGLSYLLSALDQYK